jgi:prefoldin subunit 5
MPASTMSKEQAIQILESQMEAVQQQLDQIKTRLAELKK